MKISEVTLQDVKNYCKVEDNTEDSLFTIILTAVKNHIKSYTGLTYETMDTKEDLTMALLILVNEMYENRQYTVQNDKINMVIKSILDSHCVNFL